MGRVPFLYLKLQADKNCTLFFSHELLIFFEGLREHTGSLFAASIKGWWGLSLSDTGVAAPDKSSKTTAAMEG